VSVQDSAGMWCRDNVQMCPLVWWCDVGGIVTSTLVGMGIWGGLFVALCLVLRPVSAFICKKYPSKIESEQNVSWLALTVVSVMHATLVSYLAFVAMWELLDAKPRTKFDAPSLEFPQHAGSVAQVANTSHIFFCYTLVDTLIHFWRKEMTIDYFCHHMVFCFFCVMIQYNCFAPYLAGSLLTMEISTVFLNGFTYWRNRLGYGNIIVKASFALFAFSFIVVRLGGTTYFTIFWACMVYHGIVPFHGIPRWHLHFIMAAMVGALSVQIFWAVSIGKKLLKVFKPSKTEDAKKTS